MRTEYEILARQKEFCDSYRFKNQEYTPKIKAWDSALNASTKTRGYPVYSSCTKNREETKLFWKMELERIGEKYKQTTQTREQFVKDVFKLQDSINSSQYRCCFANDKIRVGQCQKSLSIFLKWMWCQHELADIPPVCAIDRKILQECYTVLRNTNKGSQKELKDCKTAWSNLEDRELYERLVTITEKVAELVGEPRTAVWELFAFKEPNK